MPFADALEDTGNFTANWYVLLPCIGLLAVLLLAGTATLVIVLVKSQGRPRRRPDDDN